MHMTSFLFFFFFFTFFPYRISQLTVRVKFNVAVPTNCDKKDRKNKEISRVVGWAGPRWTKFGWVKAS